MKNTVRSFRDAKAAGEKMTMLTAYDYSIARLMDDAGINAVLVGDSLGMVALGYTDTLPVTVDDMVHHTRAVGRGLKNALLVTDMPFMSYQVSVEKALENAARLVKEGGAQALKLEGGVEIVPQIEALVRASIPVMGHIGMTPQSVNAYGGFRVQGRKEEEARRILADARAVEKAGAFSVVLECVPAKVAALVSRELSIPTIGIGAGPDCDGQVLVWQDMLGLFSDFTPRFVKQYAKLGEQAREAFVSYIEEVRSGAFPAQEHSFGIDDAVIEKLY